uniref:Mitochondrial 28s ribosomal protein s27 n=1 Tax=Panagrellus redivivus TaxID=6233 RepID=A0A7E4VGR9_PANRE
MLSRRGFSMSALRKVLSPAFRLDSEWQKRHSDLKALNLGGDYEWIAAVQKKFVGGGRASAVDVDAAACLSEESDQLEDVLELVYKLRHTDNAADLLPSTEYATLRLLLKHGAENELFKVLNDPINYGIFPNYHSAGLLLDHFLRAENFPAAAKIATILMQQEMFDHEVLNLLALYALLKFTELPSEARSFDETIQKKTVVVDEDDINEEELRSMKFPFLKNPFFDGHFDLEETDALVGKALSWFNRELASRIGANGAQIDLLATALTSDLEAVGKAVAKASNVSPSVAATVKSVLEKAVGGIPEEGREENDQFKAIQTISTKLESSTSTSTPALSATVLEALKTVQQAGEEAIVKEQKTLFTDWNTARKARALMQAERVNLRLRIAEIKAEIAQHEARKEELFFFENRVRWEDKAAEQDKLFEEFNLNNKDETVTESEYAKEMFEKALEQKRKQATA